MIFHESGQLNHFVSHFKYLLQICTRMNGFKFDFSKIFWGGVHRAPSPNPSPAFSRASPSVRPRFGLRPQFSGASRPRLGARALPSILGRFALDSGFALNFRLATLVCPPPPNKFLDPPLARSDRIGPSEIYFSCFQPTAPTANGI